MPRPLKARRIGCKPDSNYFKPRGIPLGDLGEVVLTMDELEAVRLADFEGIYQEAAAKRMNISRQTFGNIIKSAHQKIADALVNAKALRIEGGVVTMVEKLFNCIECKHEWSVPYGIGRPDECPQCGGSNVHRSFDDRGHGRRGGSGRGRGKFRRRRGDCPDCSSAREDETASLAEEASSSKEELAATEKRLSELETQS